MYQDYFAVRNVFKKIKSIYQFDEIISVTFDYNRFGRYGKQRYLTILTASDGRLNSNSYPYNITDENIEKLKSMLKEKNVLIKTEED